MYKDPRQDLGRSNNSYTRYPKKRFTQIYRHLYGGAMLVPIRTSTNMADGNQHKHLSPSFATKSVNLLLEELTVHEVFRKQNSPQKGTFLTYMTAL